MNYALIVPFDKGFRVCGSDNGRFLGNPADGFCWLGKFGWIPVSETSRNNSRHSCFSSIETAEKSAIAHGAISVKIP